MSFFLFSLLAAAIITLISIGFVTLLERRLIGSSQLRPSTSRPSWLALFQPLLDGLKLFVKDSVLSWFVSLLLFILSPLIAFCLMLLAWYIIPLSTFSISISLTLIFFMVITGFSVFSVLFSGWSSSSKYGMLGSLRASALSVSYEVSLALLIYCFIRFYQSFSLVGMVELSHYSIFILSSCFIIWFLSSIAECNRHPFDFAEGESELVSGFNLEYGSIFFSSIFIAEYGMVLFAAMISSLCFFSPLLLLFCPLLLTLCLMLRASLPRSRLDWLMSLAWFLFLPISICCVLWLLFFLLF